jgi:hypothetical protein
MYPMPTFTDLKKAREEFENIEPHDFFYWSVTKLVSAVMDENPENVKIDELVCALMMLLTTWNKNYYRFFADRKPGMTMKQHFSELESVVSKHFDILILLRKRMIDHFEEDQEPRELEIFQDFTNVLGRVGAAKCLHLLAPSYFPLWDAAILQGYGMEKGKYRHMSDAARYVEFMKITKSQLDGLGDLSQFANPLKSIDEYNYCRFTRNVQFD